jgi:hypothetical protein
VRVGDFVTEFLFGYQIKVAERDFHKRLRRMRSEEKIYASAKRLATKMQPEAGKKLLDEVEARFAKGEEE